MFCACGSAGAQTCSAGMSNMQFGLINPLLGAAVRTDGTLKVQCGWPLISAKPQARVCLNLGAGDASTATHSGQPRSMSNGPDRLLYILSGDAQFNQRWGSAASGGTPIAITLTRPLIGTIAEISVRVYGLVLANQLNVPTKNNTSTVYNENYGATNATVNYGFYLSAAPDCSSLPVGGTFPFRVQATIENNCTISATDLNFGERGLLTRSTQARSAVVVQCTRNDAFRISLDGGASGNPADRRMRRGDGGDQVRYQLYVDTAGTRVWGDGTAGTEMITGVGTGDRQTVSVYGQIPVQPSVAPGAYGDVITATVMF
jgi:spore coat protein U-like protein